MTDSVRAPGVVHPERIESAGSTEEEKRNAALVRKIFEALGRSEFEFLYANMAENGRVEVIGLTPAKMGEPGRNPNLIPETFDKGMSFEIENVLVDNNRVCVQWNDEAETSKGFLYRNQGLSLFVFDEAGKISEYYEYLDPDNFLEAIGAK